MSCDKFRDDIAAFLDGELDVRADDELRRHAEVCAVCAADIKANAVLVDMLKSHQGRDVPESVETKNGFSEDDGGEIYSWRQTDEKRIEEVS